MGRTATELIGWQLAASPASYVFSSGHPSRTAYLSAFGGGAVTALHDTSFIHGYISRSGDRLRLEVWVEKGDGRVHRTARSQGKLAEGVIPLAGGVSEQLFGRVLPDRSPELNRARQAIDAAERKGDTRGRIQGLQTLAKLTPGDPRVFRALGQTAVGARRYTEAAGYFRQSVTLEPEDGPTWNSLGYALAYAGDVDAATDSLRRYERISPADPNPLDSLGDAHYLNARFSEAEKFYLQATAKAGSGPAQSVALQKAAYARLLTGDRGQADALHERYVESLGAGGGPLGEHVRAEWEYLTGHREQAVDRLESWVSGPPKEWFPLAHAQIAIWKLDLGNRAAARRHAEQARDAASNTASAPTRIMVLLALFITQPEASASEWALRAEGQFEAPGLAALKSLALAYALTFAGEYAAAAPHWKSLHEHAAPTAPGDSAVLLAWTLLESKRGGDAAALLKLFPLPQPGPTPFAALTFPRVLLLRGLSLKQQGRDAEAERSLRLFRDLTGNS